MTSTDVPWAKVTVTTEAVQEWSGLVGEIERLEAEVESLRALMHEARHQRDLADAEVERLRQGVE